MMLQYGLPVLVLALIYLAIRWAEWRAESRENERLQRECDALKIRLMEARRGVRELQYRQMWERAIDEALEHED